MPGACGIMRLDRFVCKSTELSKIEATHAIHCGQVAVNGTTIFNASHQVHENNLITLNNHPLKPRPFRYILMHKPANTVCSNVDETYPSLFHSLNIDRPEELHIVGRLDADTTGLVLITDDGRWSFNITRPSQSCNKVYRVGLSKPITNDLYERFKNGIWLQGEPTPTLPAELSIISSKEVLLTITEGRFHQVKRMFAAVGNRVCSLHRERIGHVTLDVELGAWRYLADKEVLSFNLLK